MTDPTPPAILTAEQVRECAVAISRGSVGKTSARAAEELRDSHESLRRQVAEVTQERDEFKAAWEELGQRIDAAGIGWNQQQILTVFTEDRQRLKLLTDTVAWLKSNPDGQGYVETADVLARLDPPQDH